MGRVVGDVNRGFRNAGSLAVQRDVFIVRALLSGATRSSSFLTPRSYRLVQLASFKCRRRDCCSRYAFSVLLRSPELAFRNGRDKELEVAEQWDLISHGSTTYTTTLLLLLLFSPPSHFHTRRHRRRVDRVLLCVRQGDIYLTAYNYRPRKTSSPHHQTVPSFSSPLYGINVFALSMDVINPRCVNRPGRTQMFTRKFPFL